MPPYPGPDHTDDLQLACALAERSPGAVLAVFHAYGPWLYDYAHGLLQERDAAADAVHETFLIADRMSGELADPDRLRARLYWLTRLDCQSRADRTVPGAEASDIVLAHSDDPVRLERGRGTVRTALAHLDTAEREISDLTLRHGLDAGELAEVLELPEPQVAAAALRVQESIADRLGATLGREVRTDHLPTILEILPFAGLPVDLEYRLRGSLELRAGLPPVVAPVAVGWDELPPVPEPQPAEPPERWADERPAAEPMVGPQVPVVLGGRRPPEVSPGRRAARWLIATGVTGGGALLVLFVAGVLPGGAPGGHATLATPDAGHAPLTATPRVSPAPTTTPGEPAATTATPAASAGLGAAVQTTTRPRDKPAPPPSTPTPSATRRATAPAATAGRLQVDDSACSQVYAMGLPGGCEIKLTAVGGPVRWSVAGVSSGVAQITADGGGDLTAGRSTAVHVMVIPTARCWVGGGGQGTVTFAPGGTATVSYRCGY